MGKRAVGNPARRLERRLAAHRRLAALLAAGSAEAVRIFLTEIIRFFTELAPAAGVDTARAPVLVAAVAQDAFHALLCYRRGKPDAAVRLLVARWRGYLEPGPRREPRVQGCEPRAEDDLLLRVFAATVAGVLVEQGGAARGQPAVARLTGALGVSYDDLGRVLGVSGETVRRWANGKVGIPDQPLARLDVADAALSRLVALFRPERLREVIRRPAELFGGERALDWILRGRIAEVADRYEAALAYQA